MATNETKSQNKKNETKKNKRASSETKKLKDDYKNSLLIYCPLWMIWKGLLII